MDGDIDGEVRFHAYSRSSSISSLQEAGQTLAAPDPYDFSPYMDKVSYSHFDVSLCDALIARRLSLWQITLLWSFCIKFS